MVKAARPVSPTIHHSLPTCVTARRVTAPNCVASTKVFALLSSKLVPTTTMVPELPTMR